MQMAAVTFRRVAGSSTAQSPVWISIRVFAPRISACILVADSALTMNRQRCCVPFHRGNAAFGGWIRLFYS